MATRSQASRDKLLALAIGLLPATATIAPALAQTPGAEVSAAKAGIRVAPVILAEPDVETSISIQIGPEGAVPRQTFLRVRGMPLAAKLSEGHIVSPGVWAVPLSALPSLKLLAPLASSGRTEIHLTLVGVDGGVLAETKSSLVVAPAWLLGTGGVRQDAVRVVPQPKPEPTAPAAAVATQPMPPPPARAVQPVAVETLRPAAIPVAPAPQPIPRAEAPAPAPVIAALPPAPPPANVAPPAPAVVLPPPPPVARPAPPPPPAKTAPAPLVTAQPSPAPPPAAAPAPKAPPVLSGADKERADSMVQRGETSLRQGNVAVARQFFRRAAEMGLAAGALRMGATYDPVELTAQSVVGIAPDPAEASRWYERARELGAPEASARLSRLQGR